MQNFVLHKKLYQLNRIDESEYSKEAFKRYENLRLYSKLRSEGCSKGTALEAIGMSRSTYYRWLKRYNELGLDGLEEKSKKPHNVRTAQWTKETEKLVLKVRRKYRLWGKYKLSVIIKREYDHTISKHDWKDSKEARSCP